MTKIQRQKHIESINKKLESLGFVANRFGIYHKDKIKIDTRETNIKIWRNDFKILSKPLVQISEKEIEKFIIVYI